MLLTLFRLGAWLVPHLPLRLAYRLADGVGDAFWRLNRRARARIEHNQWRAIGPGATERQVAANSRKVLRNIARLYVDEFHVPRLSGDELRERIRMNGLEHVERALEERRGLILTSAHFGATQVVGQMLALLGYPTTAVVEHLKPEEVFQRITTMRASHGLRLVPHTGSMIPLLRTLRKENGIVGLAIDRNLTNSGVTLPFLGEETLLVDGAVRLALRADAPLLFGYCRRRPDDETRFEAFFQPPVELPDPETECGGDFEAAVREGMIRLFSRLEPVIRQQPEQWLMTLPLWEDSDGDNGEEAGS